MSWKITDNTTNYVKITGEKSKTVQICASEAISVAENDQLIVCAIGRVRPYNADYPVSTDCTWLLSHFAEQHPSAELMQKLAGFFLLLVFNKTHNTLSLINDHIGSMPCYVDTRDELVLRISDNVPDLLVQNPEKSLNTQALFNYVFYHCIPSPISIYNNISKLEPGVIATIATTNTLKQTTYYTPDFTPSTDSTDILQRRCADIISEAVRRNITDDCAAFLSGGLDSSTVTGMLAKHNKPVGKPAKTYSIGFEAKGYDETEYAQLTANHFATEHKVHYLQPDEIAEHFTQVAGYFNEPFGNSSAMAAYICAKTAKADGINVMLAGDGGDEIFAGNERYVKQKVFQRYSSLPAPMRALLNVGLDNSLADKVPGLKKGSSYVRQAKVPLPDRLDSYNFVNRFDLNHMFGPELLQHVNKAQPAAQKRTRYNACASTDAVDKMMYLDWKFTLADNDFVKVRQMCHMAGVEVRFPLIEKELVDFSCTVPASIKAPGQKLRDFYKNSFRGFLPDGTLSKAKHGFGLPFGVWMKQRPDLQHIALNALHQFKHRNVLQPAFIDQAIDTYENGHSGYYGELVWILVVLELWLQQHEANDAN